MIAASAIALMAVAGCAGNDTGDGSEAGGKGSPSSSGSKAPGTSLPPGADPDTPDSDQPGGDKGKPDTGDGYNEDGKGSDPGKPSPGEREIPDKQIDGSALPKGYPQKAAANKAGTKLTITGQESGCGKASAELVEQTGSQVVVLLVHTVPKTEQMCTMDIRFPPLTVHLDDALGERTLVLKAEERKE